MSARRLTAAARTAASVATFAAIFFAVGCANAADVPASLPSLTGDADALDMADQAPTPSSGKAEARNWRAFGEGALSQTSTRGVGSADEGVRLSLDVRYDDALMPGLRAVLSNRLDMRHSNGDPRDANMNTLREAYLSWQVAPDAMVDIGRVNLRYGSAMGYNPTDFFKVGALRSIISPDPASLRENRQGTVVVQGQKLWSDNSVALVLSPRLGSNPSDSAASLDFGATNPRNRWLLAGSHKFSEQFNPQVLLHGGEGMATQGGFNLSGLVNSATVAFAELSAGKGRSLTAQAFGLDEPERLQRRAALGATYTTSFNLSLTTELEYNSAAPDADQWNALRSVSPMNPLRMLGTSMTQQDLPVRRAVFVYASWKDAAIKNLDLSGFVRRDSETRSREQWLEMRYRWQSADAALQWQLWSGGPDSLYGSTPRPRRLEFSVRFFL